MDCCVRSHKLCNTDCSDDRNVNLKEHINWKYTIEHNGSLASSVEEDICSFSFFFLSLTFSWINEQDDSYITSISWGGTK